MDIKITNHAYERAKERFNLNRSSVERAAQKAFDFGIKHSDTKGKLNKYITSLWYKQKSVNNIRIYGENVFFFSDNVLITLYQIPNEFKKYLKLFKNEI